MIILDTSFLIDSLSGPRRSAAKLRGAIDRGERLALPAVVLYEWLRAIAASTGPSPGIARPTRNSQ